METISMHKYNFSYRNYTNLVKGRQNLESKRVTEWISVFYKWFCLLIYVGYTSSLLLK